MAMSPALAKKIADAKSSIGGINIRDGEYVFIVKRVLCESKFTGTYFIVEFEVKEAMKVDVVDKDGKVLDITPNKENSSCSVAFGVEAQGKAGQAALSNTKQFVCGLYGLDDKSTDEEEFMRRANDLTSDDQPARGMLVHCVTYRKVTQSGKNAGKEGTYPRFFPLGEGEGNTAGEISDRRTALDKANR